MSCLILLEAELETDFSGTFQKDFEGSFFIEIIEGRVILSLLLLLTTQQLTGPSVASYFRELLGTEAG